MWIVLFLHRLSWAVTKKFNMQQDLVKKGPWKKMCVTLL